MSKVQLIKGMFLIKDIIFKIGVGFLKNQKKYWCFQNYYYIVLDFRVFLKLLFNFY
jgi:hypothetical protein